ncbi:putative NRPS-like protein biosynthetic cluster, partial [Arthroderma sp. PD_2]
EGDVKSGAQNSTDGVSELALLCVEQWVASLDEQQLGSKTVTLEKAGEWALENPRYREYLNTCLLFDPSESLRNCKEVLAFDLVAILEENTPSPRIWIQFSRNIVDNAQAQNLASELKHIIDSIAHGPQNTLANYNSISEDHLRQIISWNTVAPSEPLDTNIHTLIRQQCLMHPDAQAVCAWDGELTYRDLDRLSSIVQGQLQQHGVGSHSIVPLHFEKSKWTPVAVLGVLKAGAAFVLLDPSYPQSRIEAICGDIKAQVIVSSVTQLPSSSSLVGTVVVVDDTIEKAESIQLPTLTAVRSDAVAYIAYTSGSTGVPKGIMIEHASFCSNSIASSKPHNLDQTSRVLQFASYAFDVSIHENLTPLILGGCVCIPSESQRVNQLKDAITHLGVNWMELTPSVARLLRPEDIPTVKTLVLGGEAMLPSDITSWNSKLRLICAYGPAECTVVSTVMPKGCQPGNIGRSYSGTCWIVDKDNHHKLLPIGASGELVIGGFIVGRGYLNRPQQTAAAFIQNPSWLSTVPSTKERIRFYKTGDLARYNSDGTIMCLGRKDTQVKIHGQRIELGDVEHHSQKWFPDLDVAAEVVVPADQKHKSPSLVLFVARQKGPEIYEQTSDSLFCPLDEGLHLMAQNMKEKLRDEIPRYMIPSAIIPIAKMPLSRTGKVDRKTLRNAVAGLSEADFLHYRSALQRPVASASHHLALKASPCDDAERLLQKLFAETLGVPENEVRSDDNFFRLGGDSISAITLVGKAREDHNL